MDETKAILCLPACEDQFVSVDGDRADLAKYRHKVIREGLWSHPSGKFQVEATPERMANWVANTNNYLAHADVWVPERHTNLPSANRGYARRFELLDDEDGKKSVAAVFEITSPDMARQIDEKSVRGVSVGLVHNLNVSHPDGRVEEFGEGFEHVALTLEPVVTSLGEFEPVAEMDKDGRRVEYWTMLDEPLELAGETSTDVSGKGPFYIDGVALKPSQFELLCNLVDGKAKGFERKGRSVGEAVREFRRTHSVKKRGDGKAQWYAKPGNPFQRDVKGNQGGGPKKGADVPKPGTKKRDCDEDMSRNADGVYMMDRGGSETESDVVDDDSFESMEFASRAVTWQDPPKEVAWGMRKASKEECGYTSGTPEAHCSGCLSFGVDYAKTTPENGCELVQSPILSSGMCKYFRPRRYSMAKGQSTTVQTLIFSKKNYSAAEAKAWAAKHKFHAGKVDENDESVRLRQRDPSEFADGSFRTIALTDGVKAVIGKLKTGSMDVGSDVDPTGILALADDGTPESFGDVLEAELAKDAKKPYGDVDYADPGFQADGVRRYPLDSESHIRSAWSYIHQARNRKKYSPKQLNHIESRIRGAWKSQIDKAGPASAALSKDQEDMDVDLTLLGKELGVELTGEDPKALAAAIRAKLAPTAGANTGVVDLVAFSKDLGVESLAGKDATQMAEAIKQHFAKSAAPDRVLLDRIAAVEAEKAAAKSDLDKAAGRIAHLEAEGKLNGHERTLDKLSERIRRAKDLGKLSKAEEEVLLATGQKDAAGKDVPFALTFDRAGKYDDAWVRQLADLEAQLRFVEARKEFSGVPKELVPRTLDKTRLDVHLRQAAPTADEAKERAERIKARAARVNPAAPAKAG